MSEQSSHRQILRSSSIIGGASIINIIIGLLRIKIVAVLLGPAGIGLIGILQNLMVMASTIAALGFGTVGTRQIAEAVGREDYAGIVTARRALFWGGFCLSVFGGGLLWMLRHVIAGKVLDDPGMASSIGWLAFGVVFTVASGSQGALLSGMRRVGDIARVQVYSAVTSTVLGIGVIWLLGEAGLLLFIVVGPLSAFAVGYFYVARLPKMAPHRSGLSALVGQWKTMAKLGAVFMVAGLVGVIGQFTVRTLVQRELGAVDLGYFQAAWLISMTYLGFVLGAMGTDYYPRLTAAIHDHATANRLVNEQIEVALLLAGPVLIGMLAVIPWVIPVLYSAEFSPAAGILRWQLLGDVLKIISWPLGFILLSVGAGRAFMLSELAAITVFAGGTWLALPWLGLQATGVSFLLMYMVYLPLLYWLARYFTGFRLRPSVLRDALLLCTAAGLVAACGAWHQWLGALLGLLAAAGFGVASLLRLARMAELAGPLGRLAGFGRRYLYKFGMMRE